MLCRGAFPLSSHRSCDELKVSPKLRLAKATEQPPCFDFQLTDHLMLHEGVVSLSPITFDLPWESPTK